MTLIGFRSRNHPQQKAKRGRAVDVDDRAVTPEFFAHMVEMFGPFDLDAAAAPHNARCDRFCTEESSGLDADWGGQAVWCNPPYSDIRPWVAKAWDEASHARLIVMLLPANRTEQSWWQDLVEPFRDREGSPLRTQFLRGRLRFLAAGETDVPPNSRPPFGCVLLVWRSSP